ncbi:hypothetical protein [Micrococcus sp. KRD153]|uniref:hypothetical protein n=1 Tax=Micrococcus sp. KRD153 TaxID=2729724 RepID=UPI001F49FAD5|nr:hypothetical protein [Micrococcus sp. KRD153]
MDEQILTTGRLFRATGRIVALSELVAPRSRPDGLIDQRDTIVLPEHRGHRLGMRAHHRTTHARTPERTR